MLLCSLGQTKVKVLLHVLVIHLGIYFGYMHVLLMGLASLAWALGSQTYKLLQYLFILIYFDFAKFRAVGSKSLNYINMITSCNQD